MIYDEIKHNELFGISLSFIHISPFANIGQKHNNGDMLPAKPKARPRGLTVVTGLWWQNGKLCLLIKTNGPA